MSRTGPEPANSVDNVTVAELLALTAPPRSDTTGCHLTNAGPQAYILTIQGPEARWLVARVLEFTQAMHDQMLEKGQIAND